MRALSVSVAVAIVLAVIFCFPFIQIVYLSIFTFSCFLFVFCCCRFCCWVASLFFHSVVQHTTSSSTSSVRHSLLLFGSNEKKNIQKSLSLSLSRALLSLCRWFHRLYAYLFASVSVAPLMKLTKRLALKSFPLSNEPANQSMRPGKETISYAQRKKKDNGNSTEMRNNDEKSARTMKQIEIDQSSNIGSGAHSWRSVHQNNFLKLKRTKTVNDWNAKAIAPKTNKSNTQKIHFVNSSKNRSQLELKMFCLETIIIRKPIKMKMIFRPMKCRRTFFFTHFLKQN